jgi:hypothetical protein
VERAIAIGCAAEHAEKLIYTSDQSGLAPMPRRRSGLLAAFVTARHVPRGPNFRSGVNCFRMTTGGSTFRSDSVRLRRLALDS